MLTGRFVQRSRPTGRVVMVVFSVIAPVLVAVTPAATAATTSGAWLATGAMANARSHAAAILLPSGKVLAVGGPSSTAVGASAELYDPVSGTWQPTGSMSTPRQDFAAALLPDGTVLAAGGLTAAGALASAELYDPVSGSWQPTGSMTTGRYSATMTVLPNGSVLVAGGAGSGGAPLASAELYEPASRSWQLTGSMTTGRKEFSATLLHDGTVLAAGGQDVSQQGTVGLTTAEIYDPATGQWRATGPIGTGVYGATATLLLDGRVLLAGGISGHCCVASIGVSSAELYDPTSGTWRFAATMHAGRYHAAAVLLPGGDVLVTGGYSNGTITALPTAETYNPATDTWTDRPRMYRPRVYQTATLLSDGRVLVVGGTADPYSSTDQALASAEIYDPNGTPSGPQLSLSTTSLSFPGQAANIPALPMYVVATNTGWAPLQVSGLTSTSPDYTATTEASCASVPPGGACVIDVVFTPHVVGDAGSSYASTGQLQIESNAPDGPYTVALDGHGLNVPGPQITAITPASGNSPMLVTITGSHLSGGVVAFGNKATGTVSPCSDTSCTASAPVPSRMTFLPGTSTADVTVTTAAGVTARTPADQFTYVSPPPTPVVTTISPTTGPAGGGTEVTVTGTALSGGTVYFGSAAATGTVCSDTTCTTISPAGTGIVDVTVGNGASGTSATSTTDRFTYNTTRVSPPTVSKITPTSGPAIGGTAVTITGINLSGATVAFGIKTATGVTCTATSCSAIAPPGSGTVHVTVKTSGGTSTTSAADQFTYQAAAPGANLVPNPGFETSALPSDYWGGKLTRAATVVHSGVAAMAQTASSKSGGWENDADPSWYAPVTAGKTYTAAIWVRATATVKITLNVDLLKTSGAYHTSANGSTVTLVANTWTQLTLVGVKTPAGAAYAAFEPNFSAAATGTVMYWDDMTLTTP